MTEWCEEQADSGLLCRVHFSDISQETLTHSEQESRTRDVCHTVYMRNVHSHAGLGAFYFHISCLEPLNILPLRRRLSRAHPTALQLSLSPPLSPLCLMAASLVINCYVGD